MEQGGSWFWLGCLSRVKMLAGAGCSHIYLSGLENLLLRWLTCLASWGWSLAVVLRSAPRRPHYRAAWVSSYGGRLPPEYPREQVEVAMFFMT